MNNGKICVSVCAETVDEFIKKIERAAEIADVIELRIDCLRSRINGKLLDGINKTRKSFIGKLLVTYRPKSQGGKADLTFQEREEFWIHSHIFEFVDWADIEEDIPETKSNNLWGKAFETVIKSHHSFSTVPENVENILGSLTSNTDNIAKIAVKSNEITDSLAVWKLLKPAKSDNKQLIPIAMGEAGKWTRILGLAHGSPITYASLEEGNETAPGQISARDLIEVYRVKELDKQTEVYGIIGNPVSHSLSPYMHNAVFKHHKLNAVYIPFEVSNLDEFIKRMVREETREIDWNLKGFSVTIPHKEAILKHLDFIDEDARKIGAVNTVKILDGKLHGYNTDAEGFIEPLRNYYGDVQNANIGIIGNGGAARACIYALKKHRANVTVFARNLEKNESLANEFRVQSSEFKVLENDFSSFDILVNTSPLGTKGELENETPAIAEQIKNIHLAYDLVYNPIETLFLREAKSVEIPTIGGLKMLVAQGMKQFEIWTELDPPAKIMKETALDCLKKETNRKGR